ncbi:MAG: aldo/keto reductase [Bacteroidales bacterium]|nr:aldo/keto reductase [Bacteroidales bacterium]
MKQTSLSRRNFLKTSLIGTAGITVGSKAIANTMQEEKKKTIIYRKLGNTDLVLPIVSMGVMRSDSPNLVKAALDSGIKHFDTAHGYQQGNNELMLGNFFKDISRDSYTIATKIHPDRKKINDGEMNPEEVKKDFLDRLAISLQRLQTDHVDILYNHAAGSAEDVTNEAILDALLTAKKEGKTRYIGVSTHRNEPDVIQAAIDSGVIDVVLVAINFKQQHNTQIKEKIALAAEKGIGIIAMKTMAGAFLDKERTQPINCKAALKWVMQDTNVHTSIPAITAIDILIENLSVMENLELTEDEMKDLQTAGLVAGLYCDGCNECTGQCRKGLPVHDIMRAYMYAYGYNDFKQAHSVIKDIGLGDNPCKDCDQCTIKCIRNFNIAEKIGDISRLSSVPEDFLA